MPRSSRDGERRHAAQSVHMVGVLSSAPDDNETALEPLFTRSPALPPGTIPMPFQDAVQSGRHVVRSTSPTPTWSSPLPNRFAVAAAAACSAAVAASLLVYYDLPGLWSRSRRLGLETVSRRTNVSSRSRLEKKLSASRSLLRLGHLRLVPKTNFRDAGHSTQCERALDVVSLCCSYYCSS